MLNKLETERLIIRPTSTKDAELVHELMNTPKFLTFVGNRNITSIDAAKNYIQTKMLPQLERLGYSSYSIVTKAEQTKIGTCGLYDREGVDGIDIGFGLLPHYEGLGYAYEAASATLKAAFLIFKIEKINAITANNNYASMRLLEKLGLVKIGTTVLPNETKALLLYQINRKKFIEATMQND